MADLSETTVVLPPTPTEQEIETFVTLMGHFSRQTGYPALRVTVAGPDALHAGRRQRLSVIGTGDDQPGFDKLAGNLPVALRSGQIQVHDTQGFFAPSASRVVEAAVGRALGIRRPAGQRHAGRGYRGNRVAVRPRRRPQHCGDSPAGRERLSSRSWTRF